MNANEALLRAAAAAGLDVGITLASGSSAGAGEPANQACVGDSLSALATTQPFPGAFGAAVVGFGQDPNLPPRDSVTGSRRCRPVRSPMTWCPTHRQRRRGRRTRRLQGGEQSGLGHEPARIGRVGPKDLESDQPT
jgi:hypothetical protein